MKYAQGQVSLTVRLWVLFSHETDSGPTDAHVLKHKADDPFYDTIAAGHVNGTCPPQPVWISLGSECGCSWSLRKDSAWANRQTQNFFLAYVYIYIYLFHSSVPEPLCNRQLNSGIWNSLMQARLASTTFVVLTKHACGSIPWMKDTKRTNIQKWYDMVPIVTFQEFQGISWLGHCEWGLLAWGWMPFPTSQDLSPTSGSDCSPAKDKAPFWIGTIQNSQDSTIPLRARYTDL